MIFVRLCNRWVLFAALVLALALGLDNEYYFTLLNFIGIYTLLVVGLNLLLGYAGQISLGHAAFFGLGAYTSGILTATYGVNPWLALLAGLVISGGAALLIGIPALKLRGYYLAMATLGFGIIVYIVLNQAHALTGGPSGLSGIPSLSLWAFPEHRPAPLSVGLVQRGGDPGLERQPGEFPGRPGPEGPARFARPRPNPWAWTPSG